LIIIGFYGTLEDFVRIRYHHRYDIFDYQEIVRAHSLEALLISNDIWKQLPNYLRNKNLMGYPYCSLSINIASFYVNYRRRHHVRWLGLIFHFPFVGVKLGFIGRPSDEKNEKKS